MVQKLYSVNEMTKLSNLSRRQLRYYEDRGLIQNVVRDPNNNYRYYTEEHIAQLCIIKELREIGFDIESVEALLNNNNIEMFKAMIRQGSAEAKQELNRSIARYEQSMEKFNRLQEAVFILENKLRYEHLDFGDKPIEIINYPARNVVSYCYQGSFWDNVVSFHSQWSNLEVSIEQHQLTKLAPRILAFHGHYDFSAGRFLNNISAIELMFEVKETASACPYFKHLPGFKAVSAISVGDYESTLRNAYYSLFDWSKEQGYTLSDTSYEECLMDSGLTSNQNLWVSRILIPIIEEGAVAKPTGYSPIPEGR